MQAIEQVSQPHLPVKNAPSKLSRFYGRTFEVLVGVATLPLVGAAYIVFLVLSVAKKIYKRFGDKDAARDFAYSVRKFKLIYIEHSLLWNRQSGRLANTINIPKLDVIKQEEDTKVAVRMRDEFLCKNQLLSPEHLERLQKATCNGANTNGICFGAVKTIIKACLETKIESEEQLIEVISRFTYGFDAEAAGFQKIYDKTQPHINVIKNQSLELHKKEYEELIQLENRYNAAEKSLKDAMHDQYRKSLHACKNKLRLTQEPERIAYYNSIGSLIGLRILNQPDKLDDIYFGEFDTDTDAQDRFNNCPNGMYSICFQTGGYGHALAYLKFSFGSYFVDPGLGLLNPAQIPSSKLLTLLHYHYSDYGFEMYNHAII